MRTLWIIMTLLSLTYCSSSRQQRTSWDTGAQKQESENVETELQQDSAVREQFPNSGTQFMNQSPF